ncbi:unnamed protein product [Adineta ricciae]|uniref:Letm1 RBD domain-containing protein n=1 Tax=Adineta ricciae TaxID=249248 RepID=A0A815CSP8_ADIRI|nr:unnamed protein product [Adineta ricciae]
MTGNGLVNKYQSVQNRVIHEIKHYYNGFKLLVSQTGTSCSLLHQVFNGRTLTRKERKQLIRTINDLVRLVPFSVFIIVPFLEFTLPFFLKLFPNMLPSTFQQTSDSEQTGNNYLRLQLEIAKLLQKTMVNWKDEFEQNVRQNQVFINKAYPSIDGMLQFGLLFSHDFSIDKLNRLQLISLCKLLRISSLGVNSYLRLKLQFKFHRIKCDDKLIVAEGIDNLTFEELQMACQERGIYSVNIDVNYLQSRLQQWLDLHLNKHTPTTILIFSHVLSSQSNDL